MKKPGPLSGPGLMNLRSWVVPKLSNSQRFNAYV